MNDEKISDIENPKGVRTMPEIVDVMTRMKSVGVYGLNGKVMLRQDYDKDERLVKQRRYNEAGHVCESITYWPNGNIKVKRQRENGLIRMAQWFAADGGLLKVKEYDENGHLKNATCYERGKQ